MSRAKGLVKYLFYNSKMFGVYVRNDSEKDFSPYSPTSQEYIYLKNFR